MARAIVRGLALSWRDKVLPEIRHPSALALSDHPLSEWAIEVLQLVAHGRSKQEAATRLGISERTVAGHARGILGKLHLASRAQAALYALRLKAH